MAEFNWTVDDIKRAQRDFSNNFMRLDCIRIESYDIAIDCMTECIESKAADVQLVDNVQNEVLNYLFNKEREAESMPFSDVRRERLAMLREVIRYVEGIGDTNG